MKAPSSPDTQPSSRAAAHSAPANGMAIPAVQSELEAPKEDLLPGDDTAAPQVFLSLDMNEDGKAEPHTLFINPDDGALWLHSDKVTLSDFLERKYAEKHRAHLTEEARALLAKIEADASIVYAGSYPQLVTREEPRINTKGKAKTTDRKQPSPSQKREAKAALGRIAINLQLLHQASGQLMRKSRPPSVKNTRESGTHNIDGTEYCKKIVMEPLSILPREDRITGSPPQNDGSTFFATLSKMANYKRGHMLNEHLHGPGTADNLVPISTAFNNKMRTTVEQVTKDAVNANNKVVRFEAEPRGWGNYKGAFNAPDEQQLPDKFWFHVQPMQLIPGKEGSKKEDWELSNKPAIFKQEMEHNPPADLKKGAIAPETKTLNEGYYFSGNGDYKLEDGTTYLLSGTFFENKASLNYLFDPLGLDPLVTYTEVKHDLKATTRFELPPSLELVKGDDFEKTVEIINESKIQPAVVPDKSFVVIKKGTLQTRLDAYKVKLEAFIEKQRLKKAKDERDDAGKQQAKSIPPIYALPTDKTAPLRGFIQQEYEKERIKYKGHFNSRLRLIYDDETGKILNRAMEGWIAKKNLTAGNMSDELKKLVDRLVIFKDRLLEDAEKEAARERMIAGIVKQLQEKVEMDYLVHTPGFRQQANEIIVQHERFWKQPEKSNLTDTRKMLRSALDKIEIAFRKAFGAIPQPATSSPKRKQEPEEKEKAMQTDHEKVEEKEHKGQKENDPKKRKTSHTPGPFLPGNNSGGGPPSPSPDIQRFQLQNPFTAKDPT